MNKFREIYQKIAEESREEYLRLAEQGYHRRDVSDTAESVTRVDESMTDLIIDSFRGLDEDFSFESEELKKSGRDESAEADYTVIFDEIDGTGNMKDERGAFGPIIGIAEGTDPEFGDVTASMFYDIRNDVLYEAYRGEGAFMDGEPIQAASEVPEHQEAIRGVVDQAMLGKVPELAEELWKYHSKDYGSMGFDMALVASDRADFLVTGGRGYVKEKKTAEEIAPLYLVVEESGGTVRDWQGNEIENQEIGMRQEKSHDIIAAANEEIAEQVAEDIQAALSL